MKIGCLLARGCIKLDLVNRVGGMVMTAIIRIILEVFVGSFYKYTMGIGVWWIAEERMLLVFVVNGVSALLGHSVADLLHCCVLFLSGIRADARRHVSELICLSRLAANLSHGSADGLGGGIEER